ncbi:nucleoside 2-deoxyribosyltransferase [Companilactobacillus sp.]|jgi:nucleoside deoxyribosyltransferase|uniref:nucleoside 2-deoxyribosyltransferase n=1 Tax=Companilactobacillus sp. TaxID=2767905 RepID=UPI0025B9D0B6|nr:nucleoside 2-deoxyribosyltransferase [Companilactobacillus sp.]MCH4010058.1 nucleoside 2-deoxyribosyltransferase [Companilactobacillus sp.]MCH4052266.1 nucleoside 2-deoxyribosyltransferase [Companilactobacillus sp.]MCH4078000.1 nucleoside 2-deoxyribosyltransferase [Companilactobacillus sp.]MCH4126576.1 nucleoside 2-deoxyribosyltransferase [Companilactobacillus sp.]MCH4132161.1 nucleoside 2-deoxyribosyltransferase [Companilactobacillus sp.]
MSKLNRVYLAGPFFSDQQKERLDKIQALLKQNDTIGDIFRPGKDEYTDAEFGSFEWQTAVFKHDINNINMSDVVVAELDYKLEEQLSEPDSGTAWECGYAFANNVPVIGVRFDEAPPLNLMLAGSLTAFYNGESSISKLKDYDFNVLMTRYENIKVF